MCSFRTHLYSSLPGCLAAWHDRNQLRGPTPSSHPSSLSSAIGNVYGRRFQRTRSLLTCTGTFQLIPTPLSQPPSDPPPHSEIVKRCVRCELPTSKEHLACGNCSLRICCPCWERIRSLPQFKDIEAVCMNHLPLKSTWYADELNQRKYQPVDDEEGCLLM